MVACASRPLSLGSALFFVVALECDHVRSWHTAFCEVWQPFLLLQTCGTEKAVTRACASIFWLTAALFPMSASVLVAVRVANEQGCEGFIEEQSVEEQQSDGEFCEAITGLCLLKILPTSACL